MLEGTEETVAYEHVRNESIGIEMDYEYEALERRSDEGRECFVSPYDDPEDPWNYLEVKFEAGSAETVSAAIREALSEAFETVTAESIQLERAGECKQLSASGAREGKAAPNALQTVYLIPAGDGCLVAAAHCTLESAEGFGTRFYYMMQTLEVIGRR